MISPRWDIARLNAKKHVHERCSDLLSNLRSIQEGREDFRTSGLFEFLPILITDIFGFENKAGWIDTFTKEKETRDKVTIAKDDEALLKLLGARGPIFTIALQQKGERFQYAFPVSRLPYAIQRQLETGKDHPFAARRPRGAASADQPNDLILSVFEYYLFCFAYYAVLRAPSTLPGGALFHSALYTALLGEYLQLCSHDHAGENSSYAMLQRVNMEFWLEQYDTFDRDAAATDGIQAVLFAKREQVAPPRSLLQAAQYSLRHAARTHLLSHAYVRAAIVRPLYRFLRSSFSALADSTADIPVDDTVEVWLAFIDPWGVTADFPVQVSSFVLSNFVLYESVGFEFLRAARTLDFTRVSHLYALDRAVSVFLRDGVRAAVRDGEERLAVTTVFSPLKTAQPLPQATVALQQHVAALEGSAALAQQRTLLLSHDAVVLSLVDHVLRNLLAAKGNVAAARAAALAHSSVRRDPLDVAKRLGALFDRDVDSISPPEPRTPAAGTAQTATAGFEPERSPTHPLYLTPHGRAQIVYGARKCSNLDVPFIGPRDALPVASFEIAPLVRLLRPLTAALSARAGCDIELRPLADMRNWVGAAVLLFVLYLLSLLLDVALLPLTAVVLIAGGAAVAATQFITAKRDDKRIRGETKKQ